MHLRTLPALLAFVAGSTVAASFDCAKAATPVEKLICADPLLGRMDEVLARNYRGMLGSNFGGSPAELRKEQLKWLAQRDKCKDKACLLGAYRTRIDETCDYGVVSGVHPDCTMAEDVK